MAGQNWAKKIQLGKETTKGTAVASTVIFRGDGGMLSDNQEVKIVSEKIGVAVANDRSYIGQKSGSLSMANSPMTFEQVCYILEAGLKLATATQDGTGTDYIRVYDFGTTSVNSIRTYTIEAGDDQQAEEMEYSFVEKFSLSGEIGDAAMMSADWLGRQISSSTFTSLTPSVSIEEVLAGKCLVYIDPLTDAFGDTAVSDTVLSWSLSVSTGRGLKYTLDNGTIYNAGDKYDAGSQSVELSLTYQHNSTSTTEKSAWRNETGRKIRLLLTGSTVGTPGTTYSTKTIIIDVAGKYTSWDVLDEKDGMSTYSVTLSGLYNPTANVSPLTITVVNELSSLT